MILKKNFLYLLLISQFFTTKSFEIDLPPVQSPELEDICYADAKDVETIWRTILSHSHTTSNEGESVLSLLQPYANGLASIVPTIPNDPASNRTAIPDLIRTFLSPSLSTEIDEDDHISDIMSETYSLDRSPKRPVDPTDIDSQDSHELSFTPPSKQSKTSNVLTLQLQQTKKIITSLFSDFNNSRSFKKELLFQCDNEGCKLSFPTKYRLKRHKASHSDEKPWACPIPLCPYSGKTKYLLKSHMIKHDKTTIFKCDIEGCKNKFKRNFELNRHKRLAHKMDLT